VSHRLRPGVPCTSRTEEMKSFFPLLGACAISSGKPPRPKQDDPLVLKFLQARGLDTKAHDYKMCSPNLDAAYEATKRYSALLPHGIDYKSLDLAFDWLFQRLAADCGDSVVLSFDEVFATMDLSKTPGWPWSTKYSTKRELYDKEQEFLRAVWDDLLPNGEYKSFATVVVKREMRAIEKIVANRLRTIMAIDGLHIACLKRLCHDMNVRIQTAGLRNFFALGWSPFYGGVDAMVHHITNGGEFTKGFEFDISAQDSTLSEELFSRILLLRERLLSRKVSSIDKHRLRMLYYRMLHLPLVMPDGHVYLKGTNGGGGNVSGQSNTGHDSSIATIALFIYSWIRLVGTDPSEFWSNVRAAVMGDDGKYCTHPDYLDKFSLTRISQLIFDDFNIVLESPSFEPRHHTELNFLSMRIDYDPHRKRFVHILRPERILSSLLQGGKAGPTGLVDPCDQLQRITGLRVVASNPKYMEKFFEDLYRFYVAEHQATFRGQARWENAKAGYFTDIELDKLYCGYEALRTWSPPPTGDKEPPCKAESLLTSDIQPTRETYTRPTFGLRFAFAIGVLFAISNLAENIVLGIGGSALALGTRSIVKHHLGFDSPYLPGFAPEQFGYTNNEIRASDRESSSSKRPFDKLKHRIEEDMQRSKQKRRDGLTKAQAKQAGLKALRKAAKAETKKIKRAPAVPARRRNVARDFIPTKPFRVATNPRRVTSKFATSTRGRFTYVTGRDHIGNFSIATTDLAGDIVTDVVMNPRMLGAPKLRVMSGAFEKFYVESADIIVSSFGDDTIRGGLFGYWELDPKDSIWSQTAYQNEQDVAYGHGGKDFQCFKIPGFWMPPPDGKSNKKHDDYYVDPDGGKEDRFSTQARWTLGVAAPPSANFTISVWVSYRIRLYNMKYDFNSIEPGSTYLEFKTGLASATPFGTDTVDTATVSATAYNNNFPVYKLSGSTLQWPISASNWFLVVINTTATTVIDVPQVAFSTFNSESLPTTPSSITAATIWDNTTVVNAVTTSFGGIYFIYKTASTATQNHNAMQVVYTASITNGLETTIAITPIPAYDKSLMQQIGGTRGKNIIQRLSRPSSLSLDDDDYEKPEVYVRLSERVESKGQTTPKAGDRRSTSLKGARG
jgi:hypothetical protein